MKGRYITNTQLTLFEKYLRQEERAEATVKKYIHDLQKFVLWLDGREISKDELSRWKMELCQQGREAVTVNGALAAVHSFLAFMNWNDCRVKYLRQQRKPFRDSSKELEKSEYRHLIEAARRKGKERLALVMECICTTGIRVSELKYITVKAAEKGRSDISLKGKIRTILIPGKLARKLLRYARKEKIACGEIFLTAGGNSLSRRQIWGEMKSLCKAAGVDETKVFPHNLRHLFARTFYDLCRDIVRLADVLGHSSIETTRIYLMTSGSEHARLLERLGLIL